MNMCPTNAWTILFLVWTLNPSSTLTNFHYLNLSWHLCNLISESIQNPRLCARKENRNRIYMDESVIQIRKEVHYWLGKRCFKIVMGVARGLLFQQYVTWQWAAPQHFKFWNDKNFWERSNWSKNKTSNWNALSSIVICQKHMFIIFNY